MRIAVVGIAGAGALATAFAEGAKAAGHEANVTHVPQLAAGSRALFLGRRAGLDQAVSLPAVEGLRRRLRRSRPDLVLVVKGRFLRARGVARLRAELGVPILNYYPDHPLWPGHRDSQTIEALHEYDEVLVWGQHVREGLLAQGLNRVRVVPFGYDPAVYRLPPVPASPRWDAALVGQCYDNRTRYVEALAEFDVLVTGVGWRAGVRGGPLDGRVSEKSYEGPQTCVLYWQTKVALNVLAVWNVPAHNMRTFEVPASGTAMVATRTPDHEALFGEDGAVLVETPEEAREAVRALVGDEALRQRIARVGRERVTPHTYAARMREILEPWGTLRLRT